MQMHAKKKKPFWRKQTLPPTQSHGRSITGMQILPVNDISSCSSSSCAPQGGRGKKKKPCVGRRCSRLAFPPAPLQPRPLRRSALFLASPRLSLRRAQRRSRVEEGRAQLHPVQQHHGLPHVELPSPRRQPGAATPQLGDGLH